MPPLGFRHYHLGSCHLFCPSASTCYGPAALIERAEIVSSADRERSGYCLAGTVLGRRPPRRTVPRPGPGWLALPWLPDPTLRIHDAIFHRARLHHTGVLICRDFCLGLGRGVGGRIRCPLMVATSPAAINGKSAVDRPGLCLRFRSWYLATTWYWSHDFASRSASRSCASSALQILGRGISQSSLIDVKSVA